MALAKYLQISRRPAPQTQAVTDVRTPTPEPEDEIIRELVGKTGKVYSDPRPDLAEDSELWLWLLVEADTISGKLFEVLHGFRCGGARIRQNTAGAYVIRPELDPTGEISIWRTRRDYEKERDIWLKPFIKEISVLLKIMPKDVGITDVIDGRAAND